MKVFVVLCQNYGIADSRSKVSQQGYRTLAEAQQFVESQCEDGVRSRCNLGWVYWSEDCYRYEIVEVTV